MMMCYLKYLLLLGGGAFYNRTEKRKKFYDSTSDKLQCWETEAIDKTHYREDFSKARSTVIPYSHRKIMGPRCLTLIWSFTQYK